MLKRHGTDIAPPDDDTGRPWRSGIDVARELAGRYLLRYVTDEQVGQFIDGSNRLTFTTPTPFDPFEVAHWLFLPSPNLPRNHVLLLDPARIEWIQGPMHVGFGGGIQYVLPNGFPREAIVVSGAPTGRWEHVVR